MALIKCSECGKEISDKAKTCIHCGNPIYKEKVKTMDKKEWKELTPNEKAKVYAYRKLNKQWWTGERLLAIILDIIGGIFLLVFFLTDFNVTYLIISFFPLTLSMVLLIPTIKEEKVWYDNNIDLIYENDVLN